VSGLHSDDPVPPILEPLVMRHEVLSRSTDLLQVHGRFLQLTSQTKQQSATQRQIHAVLPFSFTLPLLNRWVSDLPDAI
jgi:hypothetical protein